MLGTRAVEVRQDRSEGIAEVFLYEGYMIRNTSRKAYASIVNLGNKQNLVLTTIQEHKAICNFDIAEYLRVPINQITGRTRELFEMGLVHEEYTEKHLKTGRLCIHWGLTPQGEKYFV